MHTETMPYEYSTLSLLRQLGRGELRDISAGELIKKFLSSGKWIKEIEKRYPKAHIIDLHNTKQEIINPRGVKPTNFRFGIGSEYASPKLQLIYVPLKNDGEERRLGGLETPAVYKPTPKRVLREVQAGIGRVREILGESKEEKHREFLHIFEQGFVGQHYAQEIADHKKTINAGLVGKEVVDKIVDGICQLVSARKP
ncbi:hypothetical protein HZC09_03510 [Candidatus Micrarchaeota archaeon]|nr:hypothetical protein [Candidatus Micrarchaeota archaeon]